MKDSFFLKLFQIKGDFPTYFHQHFDNVANVVSAFTYYTYICYTYLDNSFTGALQQCSTEVQLTLDNSETRKLEHFVRSNKFVGPLNLLTLLG